MILIRNIRLKPEDIKSAEVLKKKAAGLAGINASRLGKPVMVKRSLDARKKDEIRYVCSAAFPYSGDESALAEKNKYISLYEKPEYLIPRLEFREERPVIAGFGPAGMFAALVLARAGLRPLVIERGADADTRAAAVERFRSEGKLDPECNVQFGEGGAGTFSDGKLNTGTHDRRISFVLQEFAAHGAPESVAYDAKPHIGTDVLIEVVKNIRAEIAALGGEVRFNSLLTGFSADGDGLKEIEYVHNGEKQKVPCRNLILAVGHSARDTFEMILKYGVPMEPKAFSMGARIEHLQKDIDLSQYGKERGELLPAADYSLSVHLPDGESAYSFCMCPGGEVIAAASEEGGVVTNGMSFSSRAGENANAALLVTLKPEDFPGDGPLAGMYWQREIEKAAFEYGGGNYSAPAQLTEDFLKGVPSSGPGRILPSYRPGVVWGDLHRVLPEKITGVLERAIPELGRKLKGFDCSDAVLTAPETRSSSPVRILRDEEMSSAVKGLYPCGEGAGYAGGITSAAVDGLRCAEAVMVEMRKK